MTIFLLLLCFWIAGIFAVKYIFGKWQKWLSLHPAQRLKDIVSVGYYRRLTLSEFESLVSRAMKAREFKFLGDPYLGRSEKQGYAWQKGKKAVLAIRLTAPLTAVDLSDIVRRKATVGAERAFVFSPFTRVPQGIPQGLEVIWGQKLVSWFSIIGDTPPLLIGDATGEFCKCGQSMEMRVSRGGRPLLVCALFPDCQGMREPAASRPDGQRTGQTGRFTTGSAARRTNASTADERTNRTTTPRDDSNSGWRGPSLMRNSVPGAEKI